jgi:hypothetical protein
MVLAVVIDGEGRPICTEMLAGNTACRCRSDLPRKCRLNFPQAVHPG